MDMITLLLALTTMLWAQEKVVNPNTGGNPTKAATDPPEAAAGGPTPTFPSGRNQPPSRGGTLGYEPELEDDAVLEKKDREEEKRRRRNQEPEGATHVPEGADEEYPRALEGGSQP
jgi:flagellar motor protein MotB